MYIVPRYARLLEKSENNTSFEAEEIEAQVSEIEEEMLRSNDDDDDTCPIVAV